MRIIAEIRKNDNMDFNDNHYTWLIFRPEDEIRDRDMIMIGRMSTFFDRAKIEYKLNFVGTDSYGIEVHECHFMKFLATNFWNE